MRKADKQTGLPARLPRRKAFTLVELLVVIAIIGILFVVLISKVDFATEKAKAAGVQTDFRSYQLAIETVARENAGLSTLVDNETSGEEKYAALEDALNKNLDPKLHIEIDTEGKISTEAKDPWREEYTGQYLAPDTDGTVKDRGAIVMYSKGSNLKLGSTAETANGVVNITIESGKETEGADDYSISTIYTYVNGYGEIKTKTDGFGNDMGDEGANQGNHTPVNPGDPADPEQGDESTLPDENPTATLDSYTWDEIQALAKASLTADEYKSKYGIELGQQKDDLYTLVDFDNYGGFVFMYQLKQDMSIDYSFYNTQNGGGYEKKTIAPDVESMYESLGSALKAVIKKVTIKCNNGNSEYSIIDEYTCHLFIPSLVEVGGVGFDSSVTSYEEYNTALNEEGIKFDYFIEGNNTDDAMAKRVEVGGSNAWWVRSASGKDTSYWWYVNSDGITYSNGNVLNYHYIVLAFVVGDTGEHNQGGGDQSDDNLNGDGENVVLPQENPYAVLDNYTWAEIQSLAKAGLTAEEYKNKYGIEVGQKVNDTYVLVDFDNYGGFVFMYQSGQKMAMNSTDTNSGGYAVSALASKVDSLYDNLEGDLQAVIKEITIKCNDGKSKLTKINNYTCRLFLPSYTEVGGTGYANGAMTKYTKHNAALKAEGTKFDYFYLGDRGTEACAKRVELFGSNSCWLRSAYAIDNESFLMCLSGEPDFESKASKDYLLLVPAFVVG